MQDFGREGANLKGGKGIRGDVKGGELDITEETEEILGEEHRPSQGLVTQTLPQHNAAVQSHFWALISAQVNTCQHSFKQLHMSASELITNQLYKQIKQITGC